MLDKKGKLFGKVSIVDLLILLIVLVMLAGAYVAYQKINDKSVLTENKALLENKALETLQVTMRLEEVRHMTVDALKPGDEVYMKETGKYLGDIVEAVPEPATRLIYDSKGNPLTAEVPDRYDVLLTVNVPGSRLEDGYYTADNIRLVFSTGLEIKTPVIQTTPTIEAITVIPNEQASE